MDIKYDESPTLSPTQPPVTPQPAASAVTPPPASTSQPIVMSTPPASASTPPSSLPPKGPSLRISKKLLLIVGGVIVLFLIVLVIILLVRHASSNSSQMSANEQQIGVNKDKSADNDYMAAQLMTWLNKQKMSDGRYGFAQICTSKTDCQPLVADNRLGPQVAWGEFMYYKKHPSLALLSNINAVITTYTNNSVVSTVQNNFYNCKLMYQLWRNNLFTGLQKRQIQTLCTRSQQYPLNNYDGMDTVNDAQAIQIMQQSGNTASAAALPSPLDADSFISAVTAVSDLATIAKWNNDDASYRLALLYFEDSLSAYNQNAASFHDAQPLLGIAALDLYAKRGKSAYLSYAKNIFKQNNNEKCGALDHCVNTLLLARQLYNVTHNMNYRYYAIAAIRIAGQTLFDGSGAFLGKQFGVNAFYITGTRATYPTLENAMLLGIYSSQ